MYWRGKKEERKKKQDKNIMSAPAMQGDHNNQQWRNFATKSGGDMKRGQARPAGPQLEARAKSVGGVIGSNSEPLQTS